MSYFLLQQFPRHNAYTSSVAYVQRHRVHNQFIKSSAQSASRRKQEAKSHTSTKTSAFSYSTACSSPSGCPARLLTSSESHHSTHLLEPTTSVKSSAHCLTSFRPIHSRFYPLTSRGQSNRSQTLQEQNEGCRFERFRTVRNLVLNRKPAWTGRSCHCRYHRNITAAATPAA